LWDAKRPLDFVTPECGVNVIVEGFTSTSIAVISQAYQAGCRFLCIATEEPHEGKGFNHGLEREMRERLVTFTPAMEFFEGILYLVPGKHVHDYFNKLKPSAYIDLGFAPSLVRVTPVKPIFDFGFYGSVTKRRYKILRALSRRIGTHNAIKIMADFRTQQERDDAMRQARVIVQLRKYDKMGLVSSSRCNTSLMLGRPVLAEPHDLSKPWDEVIKFSDSLEAFYGQAVMMRIGWESEWRRQFEAFREKFSAERCIGQPLRDIGFDFQQRPRAELRGKPRPIAGPDGRIPLDLSMIDGAPRNGGQVLTEAAP
jgi:hypothetical protein